ncbi:MAG: hypothetical protein HGB17_04755, partial [Syntrophobacteraceae bacterium]|nr:hypothetical protein [Syntrophobacteraceae bacterium]
AAAASAVSRRTGIPILLTGSKRVPSSTMSALTAAGHPRVIVVGGTVTVPKSIYSKLGASERWGGTSRYATAASVAYHAVANGYSDVATPYNLYESFSGLASPIYSPMRATAISCWWPIPTESMTQATRSDGIFNNLRRN